MGTYDKGYYERWVRTPEGRAKKRAANARWRKSMQEWYHELKETLSCARCGFDRAPALQFHHREGGTKELNLGEVIAQGWGKQRILDEVAKCEVLCANCHLIHHADERGLETVANV
jgi:hypothetical protein